MPPKKPTTIDEYLAALPEDRRAPLEALRRALRTLLPDATECISYAVPAFRHQGHVVAGFLATKQGYSYLPFSGTTLATLHEDLAGYPQTKSSLHVPPRGLPLALLRKLVRARLAELPPAPKPKRVPKPKPAPSKSTPKRSTAKAPSRKRAPGTREPLQKVAAAKTKQPATKRRAAPPPSGRRPR